MRKKIPVDQAVGMVLPHDITEIRPGEFKGRAFRKGHLIRPEDIPHLKRLGKEHVFALELGADEIHENEAALLLAEVLAGPGTAFSRDVVEGKVTITAATDGLLKVDPELLYQCNLLGEVMCATLHTNTVVRQGEALAGTRLIPLVAGRALVERAVAVLGSGPAPALRVLPLRRARAGLVITGNEVFHGTIEDRFEPVLRQKLEELGSEVLAVRFAPDDADHIAREIGACLEAGADLIVTSGGMSVDPDDLTRAGIGKAGATDIVYGTPVLPGAMFLVATIGTVPVVGLPACGMYSKRTVFDLILPRLLAGEKIDRRAMAALGHGGLCRNCPQCVFPACSFGK